jgi:serine/threonine protein kinase
LGANDIAEFLAEYQDPGYPVEFVQQYEMIECLSHNDFGETFLIKDRCTKTVLIAKVYPDLAALPEGTENEVMRGIHHKGIPALVGEFENERMLCVVRTYAPGRSLSQIAREEAFTEAQVIDIISQLCDILSYLHNQTPPVIHRDIKPQNVILDDSGQVTLIDFGSSRRYKADEQEDTLCFGTRHYAAPEQYGYAQTDRRTDLFSLGVLLCWMLSGTVNLKEGIGRIKNGRLARIVTRCTAFSPEARFQTAQAVKEALTGRTLRKGLLISFASVVLLLVAAFTLVRPAQHFWTALTGIHFREPLIESAVRSSLGLSADEPITDAELLSLQDLFIFGDHAAKSNDDFQTFGNSFVNNDGTISRGEISTLTDLEKMPNLRHISLVYQNITDVSPLAKLSDLEYVDLRHNPIKDVSSFSSLTRLSTLILFDTHVTNLTGLNTCHNLTMLDIGMTPIESAKAFRGLDSVQLLYLRKGSLQSLDEIQTLTSLESIALSQTNIRDFTPLLGMDRLKTLEVSEDMRSAIDEISGKAKFSIVFQ